MADSRSDIARILALDRDRVIHPTRALAERAGRRVARLPADRGPILEAPWRDFVAPWRDAECHARGAR